MFKVNYVTRLCCEHFQTHNTISCLIFRMSMNKHIEQSFLLKYFSKRRLNKSCFEKL